VTVVRMIASKANTVLAFEAIILTTVTG